MASLAQTAEKSQTVRPYLLVSAAVLVLAAVSETVDRKSSSAHIKADPCDVITQSF